jgi:Tfp pilus assembly protein PilZ
MTYTGPERRKYPRINSRFVVSYRLLDEENNVDITQTKNLSLGGLLLTTNKAFQIGTNIALEIRVPYDRKPIMLIAKVVTCHEVTKNLIYDTRIKFIAMDKRYVKALAQTVDFYLKKGT